MGKLNTARIRKAVDPKVLDVKKRVGGRSGGGGLEGVAWTKHGNRMKWRPVQPTTQLPKLLLRLPRSAPPAAASSASPRCSSATRSSSSTTSRATRRWGDAAIGRHRDWTILLRSPTITVKQDGAVEGKANTNQPPTANNQPTTTAPQTGQGRADGGRRFLPPAREVPHIRRQGPQGRPPRRPAGQRQDLDGARRGGGERRRVH